MVAASATRAALPLRHARLGNVYAALTTTPYGFKTPKLGRFTAEPEDMFARIITALLRPVPFVPLVILAVAAVELAVANRKYGLFTGGFGQPSAVDAPGELALFLVGFALAQVAAALLAWRLSAWLARKSHGPSAMLHFAFIYGGLSLVALNVQYQLHSYFSDAVGFALLGQLGGGSMADALLFAKNEIALGLAAFALFCLVWWGSVALVRRWLDTGSPSAMRRPSWRWIAVAWIGFALALVTIPRVGGDGANGLGRILTWQGVTRALAATSDFDRDGYGLVGRTIDAHPFDASRHPLALDIPGNGVDEDGYGGDLALGPVPRALPVTHVTGTRPHVVIVLFESTRFDVLGKRIDGQPVAPNLEKLAAQGSAITPLFSHVGFTTASLKSLFGGALAVGPSAPSLFRDFKQSGYRIGVFSGQPEDFGGISEAIGMRESADVYVDAEKLKDQRAFSFAAQGSLLVDEAIILDEFEQALGEADDWAAPQFVYLNFQSPHFPYYHPGIPERIDGILRERSAIAAENAAAVQRTYWNAVAHADAALGRVIATLERTGAWDDTVLLVTGDHGEALFENGFLGHGHVINRLQYGTFLASNRKLEGVAAPLALSDIRRIVHGLLGSDIPAEPRFAPFMHIGELDHPTGIGTVDPQLGVISLRLDSGVACFERGKGCRDYTDLAGAESEAIERLVARWGSERWAARQSGAIAR